MGYNKIKIIFALFLLACLPGLLCADNIKFALKDSPYKKDNVKNVIYFVPSKADEINGLAVGWFMLGAYEKDSTSVNGFYLNPSPLAVIFGVVALPYIIATPFMKMKPEDWGYLDTNVFGNRINGIALSVVEVSGAYIVNGLQVTALYHNMYQLNGLSLTVGVSNYASFKGVMISGFNNNATEGKGLQIGLINRAKKMTGIQIGLWNKIGKRGLPFFNVSFKKKNPKP